MSFLNIPLPENFLRLLIGLLTHTIYRIKAINPENVPEKGGVLLTPNHMSFVDGLILQYSLPQRKVRFIVDREFFSKPLLGWFLNLAGCIPVSTKGGKDAIVQAAAALERGEAVCIFPEGSITRTGLLLPFRKGVELLLRKAPEGTKVVPVCFDKLWGSIFSYKGGKFFWKMPEHFPYPVTVIYGAAENKEITAFALRQRIAGLSSAAFNLRVGPNDTLPAGFIKTARRHLFRPAIADPTGKPLSYLKLLTASLLLSKKIRQNSQDKEMIGLMLPACNAGVIANIALGLAGKVAVNLNFRAGADTLNKAIEKCGMNRILTSRLFVKKAGLEEMSRFVYLEDLAKKISPVSKIWATLMVLLGPATLLGRHLTAKSDDVATIIFSSGSTGDPKGAMLTHRNIIANAEMVDQVMQLDSCDRILGSLPYFHSFGYTVTLWLPLLHGIFTAYVPDPLDAEKVGQMSEKYQATIMLGTPTFYSFYCRKCKKEQFAHIRLAIAGAEKLRQSIAGDFLDKFGLSLLEGYGTTEMSPVISCNVPDYELNGIVQKGTKSGSVGMALPGVMTRVVSLDDYERELMPGEEGMLLVKGASRMPGYLKDEARTIEALYQDWYITGDVAKIDEDGFIYIVGRLSRFSKIGGEMVPHIKIEEAVNQILGGDLAVITSVEDKVKGEKLLLLYLPQAAPLINSKQITEKLKESGLPNLWIPREYYQVAEFPILGSGKLDLKALNALAKKLAGL
ncbi:MAG: AMP-binding protein [Candidatus Schekmanbacteria bacterium]|nr:AMP-binding protein [Candidatus Schekmanbacteria bacterium]